MSRTTVKCTVLAEVYDEEAFFSAALRMAIDEGNTETEARDRLWVDGEINLPACWQTLVDPGVSPAGCAIIESSAETAP